jgi:hypothetical protein
MSDKSEATLASWSVRPQQRAPGSPWEAQQLPRMAADKLAALSVSQPLLLSGWLQHPGVDDCALHDVLMADSS